MLRKLALFAFFCTFFARTLIAQPLSVVINEIMFAPVKPEPEWIELLNTTRDTIDIAGWSLNVHGHAAMTIPTTNSLIPPDSMLILTSNDAALASYRNVAIEHILKCSLPDLSNTGSMLALRDTLGILVDSVSYDGSWIKSNGISIERIDAGMEGYILSNWGACKDSSGSTILRPNSIRKRDYDLALEQLEVTDSSASFTIVNVGLDTVPNAALILRIGDFLPIADAISSPIPSHDSLTVALAFPDMFYGLFPATAYLFDSLDEQHSNDTLHFSVVSSIPQDSLVLNEIMFNPQPNGCQWLELYNRSAYWISMDSTRLVTGETRPGEYTHLIPPLLIPPDSFGLIAANDSIYRTYPSLSGRNEIAALGTSTLGFGKDSCFVVLHNPDGSTIDSMQYLKSWQQSLLTKIFTGISLERKNPDGGSNDPQNWHASLDSATPLAVNTGDTITSTTPPATSTLFQAHFSPNPFSPDGDGFEDMSILTIQTGDAASSQMQWALRVRLYDARGRLVRLLTDATSVYRSIAVTFDGKRDNGQTLPPGLYTALIELTSQNPGSSSTILQTLKQAVGVAIAGKRK